MLSLRHAYRFLSPSFRSVAKSHNLVAQTLHFWLSEECFLMLFVSPCAIFIFIDSNLYLAAPFMPLLSIFCYMIFTHQRWTCYSRPIKSPVIFHFMLVFSSKLPTLNGLPQSPLYSFAELFVTSIRVCTNRQLIAPGLLVSFFFYM